MHCSAVPFQITRVRASCVFALLTEVQTPHFYAEMNVFSLFILYSDIKGLDMIYSCQNWKEKYVKCGFQEVFNITTRHLILKCMFAKSKYAFILYHGFLSVEKKFVKLASISWVALFLRFLGKLSGFWMGFYLWLLNVVRLMDRERWVYRRMAWAAIQIISLKEFIHVNIVHWHSLEKNASRIPFWYNSGWAYS